MGYWKTGRKTADDWEGVVHPECLDQSIVYPKERAPLDICRNEVSAGNQVWVYCQMTGKRDIQPRLKQLLTEAGFAVEIMRSKSVKTRDRLAWIEKQGKRANIVLSHPNSCKRAWTSSARHRAATTSTRLLFTRPATTSSR